MAHRPIIGEAAIIQGFLAPLAAGFPGAFGLLDDAATVRVPPGDELVVTMDAVAAGVHFFSDDAPADIAWKALAVNMSDLIAKGAEPLAYLMSLAMPEPPSEAWLGAFAGGLGEAQHAFGVHLIGGDTDRRPGPLTVTMTAFGRVGEGRMVRRGTGRVGDRLFVSGTLGDAALGLKLRAGAASGAGWGLAEEMRARLVGRYLRPSPPLALIPALRDHASAAMDVSDGLAKDLGRMASASGVGGIARGGDLPLSAAVRQALGVDPGLFASIVAGGDDYEILAAVAPDRAPAFCAMAAAAGVTVTDIGELRTAGGVVLTDLSGRPYAPDRPGWDHF